jgi:hypothetical protein
MNEALTKLFNSSNIANVELGINLCIGQGIDHDDLFWASSELVEYRCSLPSASGFAQTFQSSIAATTERLSCSVGMLPHLFFEQFPNVTEINAKEDIWGVWGGYGTEELRYDPWLCRSHTTHRSR